jgi:hypothetical protein
MSDDRTWTFRLTMAVLVSALSVILLQLALLATGTGPGMVIAATLVTASLILQWRIELRRQVIWGSLILGFVLASMLSRMAIDAVWGSSPVVWAGVGIVLTAAGVLIGGVKAPTEQLKNIAAGVVADAPASDCDASEIAVSQNDDSPHQQEQDPLLSGVDDDEEDLTEVDPGTVVIMGDAPHSKTRILYCERVHAEEEESLEAILMMTLEPGERHRYLHLRFEPFFSYAPIAECDCLSDGDVRAEFDILNYYGGRISLRRSGDVSQSAELELSFHLSSGRARARAA